MNDLTTGGGISEALKRRYGISDERPVATLATDLFPVVDASDGGIPDLSYTAGVRICSGYGEAGPVAAQYSGILLRNPTGSGVIATVRQFLLRGDNYRCRLTFDDPGSVGTVPTTYAVIDTRSGVSSAVHQFPSCEIRQFSSATVQGVQLVQATNGAGLAVPFVLVPGTSVHIYAQTVNTAISAFCTWQERKLENWENFRAF